MLQAAAAALWRERARRPGPVVVGVSGGLDSVLLLHALVAVRDDPDWARAFERAYPARSPVPDVICAHVHHGVRGLAADRDAAFVEELAARLRVPFVRLDVDAARVRKHGAASEGRMRLERYRLLGELARSRGATSIFVAHHRDDRIESIVLAAVRGAGLKGLGAMPRRRLLVADDPAGPWLVRPWFRRSRAELLRVALELGIEWREDATNAELTARRNRIRHVVLPRLRSELGPSIDDRLVRLARVARVLAWRAKRALRPSGRDSDAIHAQVEALTRTSIRKHASLRIQHLVTSGTRGAVDVAPGVRVRVDAGRLELDRPPRAWPAPRIDVRRFGARVARVAAALPPERFDARLRDRGFLYVDADRLTDAPRFRTRSAGDRIEWPGLPKPVRLKRLFTSHHVPRTQREALVVVEAGGRIAALEGLGVAAWARVTAATRTVMRVRIRRSDDAPQARAGAAALPS